MYRILSASKDTYITNKIIRNSFRATDANVGRAATLDLFKLYNESTLPSDSTPTEVSRLFVKFDLDPIRALTSSILDLDNGSFKCYLSMKDIYGGQTCPSNFTAVIFPLSKSFDEGIGRDIIKFNDLDSCNWLTSSVSSLPVTWSNPGANKSGYLGSPNIDIISSGTLSGSSTTQNINLWSSQVFKTGEEDLYVDVTTIVSATLKNLIPDCGFRISFSESQETDNVTRFVKRFASTNHGDVTKRPSLILKYNDAIQDHHKSFYFNISGSLFLNNYHRGLPANILSGASATQVKGSDCIVLKLTTGSIGRGTYFSRTITGSQHKMGENFVDGVYSASFAISQWGISSANIPTGSSPLAKQIQNAGSASFTEIWGSIDGTVPYLTSSLTVYSTNRTSFDNSLQRLLISITNMQSEFRTSDKYRFRVFAENIDRPIFAKKTPFETPSEIFTSMYYRIRCVDNDSIIIPFDSSHGSTLCSTDSDGMYFDLYMDALPKGKLFTIDFLLKDRGIDQIFTDVAARFKVT